MRRESVATRPVAFPAERRRRRLALPSIPARLLLHLSLLGGAILLLFPFYWMVTTSLKTPEEASLFPPTMWPASWRIENYVTAWNLAPFGRYFINTVFVACMQTLGVLTTSALAAYAFTRINFAGKNLVFVGLLGTMMIPFEVTLVPNFIILKHLHWYNSFLALIVPWTASVFAIFLLRQFFRSIPRDLYDAAEMDGCGRLAFLWRIALPLSKPALITIGLFSFLGAWNALLWPLIVTGDEEMRMLQVGLSAFQSEAQTQYHLWMAAATFTMAPVIAIYFVAQRYFIEGVSASGIKG
ncbi:MAG: carbohydrate ABC transporter permease [Dehalococcoidia bacterium]|nr:carbohydrate ABC transporter permease [Dehalococcoidia bacterium]